MMAGIVVGEIEFGIGDGVGIGFRAGFVPEGIEVVEGIAVDWMDKVDQMDGMS